MFSLAPHRGFPRPFLGDALMMEITSRRTMRSGERTPCAFCVTCVRTPGCHCEYEYLRVCARNWEKRRGRSLAEVVRDLDQKSFGAVGRGPVVGEGSERLSAEDQCLEPARWRASCDPRSDVLRLRFSQRERRQEYVSRRHQIA